MLKDNMGRAVKVVNNVREHWFVQQGGLMGMSGFVHGISAIICMTYQIV